MSEEIIIVSCNECKHFRQCNSRETWCAVGVSSSGENDRCGEWEKFDG